MKSTFAPWASVSIAALGVALAITLLAIGLIGEVAFIGVLTTVTVAALGVHFSPRLLELNLKEMKLVLDRLEKVKAEIDATYGGIDGIRPPPRKADDEWHARLGVAGKVVRATGVVNYVSGCMKRERERLAQVFILGNPPDKVAAAILDDTKDDFVFKWEPGSVPLDRPPRSLEDRHKADAAKEEAQRDNKHDDEASKPH